MLFTALSGLVLALIVLAQNTPSSPPSNSTSASPTNTSTSGNSNIFTTTITTLLSPPTSGASSVATTFTLTIDTAHNGSLVSNSTVANPSIASNGSIIVNGTAVNGTGSSWNGTNDYVPFDIPLDPTYGVLGGLLIVSGLPVAALGGKNRWSVFNAWARADF